MIRLLQTLHIMLFLHMSSESSLLFEFLSANRASVNFSTVLHVRLQIFELCLESMEIKCKIRDLFGNISPIYLTLHLGQKYLTFPLKSMPRVSSSRASSSLLRGYFSTASPMKISSTMLRVPLFSMSSSIRYCPPSSAKS